MDVPTNGFSDSVKLDAGRINGLQSWQAAQMPECSPVNSTEGEIEIGETGRTSSIDFSRGWKSAVGLVPGLELKVPMKSPRT
jgi:hypothetical protein